MEGGSLSGEEFMRINCVKDGVGFDGVLIVDLVICLRFPVYVEFLNCVHKGAFASCVKYLHNIVDGAYGMVVVQEVGCKTGFSYVVFVVMKVFVIFF
jgi:hypothetical protein